MGDVRTDRAGLVGRAPHLERLAAALQQAKRSRGGALALIGEPGTGKTALTGALAGAADDCLVLRCRGVESELGLPFSGLHELLMPLLGASPRATGLEPAQREALESALALGEQGSEGASSVAISMAVLTLVAQAAGRQPVLLIVDDLHWMDAATVPVLAFVARRIAHDRVLVLFAGRPSTVMGSVGAPTLELGALSTEEAGELAQLATGRSLPDQAIAALASVTGGNPLAIIETVRLMGDDLDRLGSVFDEPPPASELIRRGFAQRLADLTPGARAALIVVATALDDASAPLDGALEALGTAGHALDEAELAGIIERGPGTVRFAHPLLRALVFHDAPTAERRRAHAALAVTARDAGSRAWHAASATELPDEAIASALEASALGFEMRGGHLAAARALERAARLTPDQETRAHRLFRSALAARSAAQAPWAMALLDEARAEAVSPLLRLRVENMRNIVDSHANPSADLHARHLRLADDAMEIDLDLAADALSLAAIEGVLSGRMDHARAAAARLRTIATPHIQRIAEDVPATVGIVLVLSGDDPHEGARLLVETGTRRLTMPAFGHEYVVDALVWIEEFELAERLITSVLTAARATGDLHTMLGALGVDGYRRWRIGDWTGAENSLEQDRHLAESNDQPWDLGMALAVLAIVRASRGDESARELAREADALSLEHGFEMLEPYLGTALGLLELGAGQGEAAALQFARAEAWSEQAGQREPGILTWSSDLVDAYIVAGDLDRAHEALAALRERGEATGRAGTQAAVARLEGTLADGEAYDAAFQCAFALLEQTQLPFDLARTHLQYGRRLRRSGHRVHARRELSTAARGFERLGAAPWAAQASSELRATGATVATTGPATDVPRLTSQEQLVAECVAQGMTNKQIAAQLFLTVKTIEWHLRQIFRKLGIRSRVQLAQLVAQAPAGGGVEAIGIIPGKSQP